MRVLTTAILGLALSYGAPAAAGQVSLTITGNVAAFDGNYDEPGVFGQRNGVLDGLPFVATFLIDDTVPRASYTYTPLSSSASGGPAFGGGVTPLRGSIAINGVSFSLTTPGSTGASADAGQVVKNTTPSSYSINFTRYANRFYDYSKEVNFYLRPVAPFTSADYREPVSTDLTISSLPGLGEIPNGFLYLQYASPDGPDGMIVPTTASAALIARHLTVASAVPEPLGWALMLTGIGLCGAVLRRRRRRPEAAAGSDRRPDTLFPVS